MNPEHSINEQEYLSEDQRRQSEERHEAFEQSGLGEWDQDNGTLLFDIDERLIVTEQLLALGTHEHLVRKPEFHVTIIGYKSGEQIMAALAKKPVAEAEAIRQEMMAAMQELNHGWRVAPEILRIQKTYPKSVELPEGETRTSYIQLVDMPALTRLYDVVNQRLALHLEVPPTHITIMTGSTAPEHMTEGIGVPNRATLEKVQPCVVMTRDGAISPERL